MTLSLPMKLAMMLLGMAALANLWIFGRFTVDDAFITWRYGRNLLDAGFWAYNPSAADPTQAYTNPLLAAWSLIPASFALDVVLFFKLTALAILAGLIAALWRLAGDKRVLLLFLLILGAIPATLAHALSGLETVLYGGLVALWFLTVARGQWRGALICVILAALTRPEAWVLLGLHPVALILWRRPLRALLGHCAIIGAVAALYAGFHLALFGQVLPNTFFVKSGAGLTLDGLLQIAPYALPGLAVLIWGDRRLGVLLILFLLPVVYSYASGELLMNYLKRFPFQIVLPVTLICAVLFSHARQVSTAAIVALAGYLGLYAWDTRSLGDHLGIANYYPRLLDSHVAMGHAVYAAGSPVITVGDAGALPYHGRAVNLDSIGLGSARVAHDGLTLDLLERVNPEVLFRFADADGPRPYPPGFEALDAFGLERGMRDLCTLIYAPHYTLIVRAARPMPTLEQACVRSQVNAVDELRYFLAQIATPPWVYWRE